MANGVVLEGLPSWLKPSLFLQADFNAEEYVSYLRRFVSASRLCFVVHVCQGACIRIISPAKSRFPWRP